MDKEEFFDSQQKLDEILIKLSNPDLQLGDKDLEYLYCDLRQVYSENFRHMYSKIFVVLTEIQEDKELSLPLLVGNLSTLNDYCIKKCHELNKNLDTSYRENNHRFLLNMGKLYDHVNLDVARIDMLSAVQDKQEQRLLNILRDISDAQDNLNKIQKQVKDAQEMADRSQKDYIAILGIFAAIVVTFVSGISFSGMSLKVLGEVDSYSMTAMLSVIGLFMINILRALFAFLLKITNRVDDDVYMVKVDYINAVLLVVIFLSLILRMSLL